MRKAVVAILYVVVIASCVYAVAGGFALASLWDVKVAGGFVLRDFTRIGLVAVLGVGFPYCMIRYLRGGSR